MDVFTGEGRDRNLVARRNDGNGRFLLTVLVQSAQEPFHRESREFHLVSQGIAVNASRLGKFGYFLTITTTLPFHLRSGDVGE